MCRAVAPSTTNAPSIAEAYRYERSPCCDGWDFVIKWMQRACRAPNPIWVEPSSPSTPTGCVECLHPQPQRPVPRGHQCRRSNSTNPSGCEPRFDGTVC